MNGGVVGQDFTKITCVMLYIIIMKNILFLLNISLSRLKTTTVAIHVDIN